MKINNTINFQGERTSMSASGNTEWFEFTIISDKKLDNDTVKELVNAHGCGGQTFSFDYSMNPDGQHLYNGKSTRYSD
jgi:hypothetical protein